MALDRDLHRLPGLHDLDLDVVAELGQRDLRALAEAVVGGDEEEDPQRVGRPLDRRLAAQRVRAPPEGGIEAGGVGHVRGNRPDGGSTPSADRPECGADEREGPAEGVERDGGGFGIERGRFGGRVGREDGRVVGRRRDGPGGEGGRPIAAPGSSLSERRAARGTRALSRAPLYARSEPCPMCFGAAYWARVDRIVHAASRADAAAAGFDDAAIHADLARAGGARAGHRAAARRGGLVAVRGVGGQPHARALLTKGPQLAAESPGVSIDTAMARIAALQSFIAPPPVQAPAAAPAVQGTSFAATLAQATAPRPRPRPAATPTSPGTSTATPSCCGGSRPSPPRAARRGRSTAACAPTPSSRCWGQLATRNPFPVACPGTSNDESGQLRRRVCGRPPDPGCRARRGPHPAGIRPLAGDAAHVDLARLRRSLRSPRRRSRCTTT